MIQKYLKGMLVKDAVKPLRVELEDTDVTEAIPGDPENCAFALSVKRTLGVDVAIFIRGKAYIQETNGKGKKLPTIEMYIVGADAYQYIKDFDNGGMQTPNQSFIFYPPSPSQSINNVRTKREVKINYDESAPKTEPKIRTPRAVDNWRSGAGKIRFSVVKS